MDMPEITSTETIAIGLVASILNKSTEKLGIRKNLFQYARSCDEVGLGRTIISLKDLKPPLAITSEKIIKSAIEKRWHLNSTFSYSMKYCGGSSDETSQYYYHEVIFSQPTVAYPIPQATVSVFFRVQDKPSEYQGLPVLTFRVEGHHTDHDIRRVILTKDWILETLQTKIKFFNRIEKLKMF